jgi:hypothetical protein
MIFAQKAELILQRMKMFDQQIPSEDLTFKDLRDLKVCALAGLTAARFISALTVFFGFARCDRGFLKHR